MKPAETCWKPRETKVNECILPENHLKSLETTEIRVEITIFSYLDPFFVTWPRTDFRCFFMIFEIFLWHPLISTWFPLVLCGFLQFSMVSEWFQVVSKWFQSSFQCFSVFSTGFQRDYVEGGDETEIRILKSGYPDLRRFDPPPCRAN